MRGAHVLDNSPISDRRIIPADAGSTLWALLDRSVAGDHPRGCGEHSRGSSGSGNANGSSPRMRGALDTHSHASWYPRIIPADAGSTHTGTAPITSTKDHPRGCGEHSLHLTPRGTPIGSSPRMRGALPSSRPPRRSGRIIPADAGSTDIPDDIAVPLMDHPRGCGEHTKQEAASQTARGSSPRMRGALAYLDGWDTARGIIPADAGSTGQPCPKSG